MIQTSLLEHHPLPLYNYSLSKPGNWEGMVISLQSMYIKHRQNETPYNFNQTIKELVNLSLSIKDISVSPEERIGLAFAAVNLFELYMLFSDPDVNEIYCNKLYNQIVISHRKHGKCITNIEFTKEFWQALKLRVEYDTGKSLTPLNPALKTGFQSPLGSFRVALQDTPLSPGGPTFNIRRLPKDPISLDMLIEQNQLSANQARYLLEKLNERENIIIAGEPSSGKTTLANALLLQSKPYWRLIIMEDAREIVIDPEAFPMVIHYSLPAVGDDNRQIQRANEIARLLHRSPDYVFLGELQNKEDTTVAFEGFAAGIRGLATTHARDLKGLLQRWTNSHKLPKELLESISVIVFTRRELIENRQKLGILAIYEQDNGQWQEVVL